jgi:hypothetical protein
LLMLMQVMRQQCSVCCWPALLSPATPTSTAAASDCQHPCCCTIFTPTCSARGWGLFLPAVSAPVR